MIGHCGGLRQSQTIGDYVLAHGYLRRDRILDDLVPTEMPVPALAEVQVALQEAAARVTGERGDALKRRLRTGTVVSYDDRNWELRWTQERRRINLGRAIAVDMESGTLATQGYRLRVPYGTLLCVSDKPLHGEIKLPGAANAFYERAVGEHLRIGLAAIDLLRGELRLAAFAQAPQLRRAAVPLKESQTVPSRGPAKPLANQHFRPRVPTIRDNPTPKSILSARWRPTDRGRQKDAIMRKVCQPFPGTPITGNGVDYSLRNRWSNWRANARNESSRTTAYPQAPLMLIGPRTSRSAHDSERTWRSAVR